MTLMLFFECQKCRYGSGLRGAIWERHVYLHPPGSDMLWEPRASNTCLRGGVYSTWMCVPGINVDLIHMSAIGDINTFPSS